MFWDEKCLLELTHHNLFESTAHRDRFHDLITCYVQAPFFSKGLCKCMYLSSWDDAHFSELLIVLNELTISGARNTEIMAQNGLVLIDSAMDDTATIYRLSYAFLTNSYFKMPDFSMLDPDISHLIRQALLAARLIDDLPDPHAGSR